MQSKNAAFRKRTQIAIANRVMFLWVAGVSVVFGFALVAIIFLSQMLMFNQRVIHEKETTVATLKANNDNIKSVQSQVRVLDNNSALKSAKASPDDKTLQVILDALPSEANSDALCASLEKRLLDGVAINALQPDDISTYSGNASTGKYSSIGVHFIVTGSTSALKEALHKIEISIRTIEVLSMKLELNPGGDKGTLTVRAKAYYSPSTVVELTKKTVKS
ncbi:MAG: hypothetical protein WCH58_04110 [Candidatus Saccharibacteria bacterium]